MKKFLYKLGNWIYEKPKTIIACWLVIILVAVGLTLSLGVHYKGDTTIPGTKSEKAGQVLKKAFGQTKEYGTIRLIFKVEEGKTVEDEPVKNAINKTIEDVKTNDKAVTSVTSPYTMGTISSNKRIAYADITYNDENLNVKQSSKDKVFESIKISRNAGIQTELGGSVSATNTENSGTSELISIIAAFFILAVTLGSLLAAGLPIVTALIGLSIGLLSILIGTNFFKLSSFSLSLASMIGLAVGIDYALFIVSRYRQNLGEGYERKKSVALAMGTAGGAVLFAGVTVIIALCGLSLVGVPFLGVMGDAAAVMVLIVLLVSLTAVPAVLTLAGSHITPKQNKRVSVKSESEMKNKNSNSNLWGRVVTGHPIIVIISILVLTILLAYSALDLELGLPDNGMMQKSSTARKGYDILSEGFGEGSNGALYVVADASSSSNDSLKAIQDSVNEIKGLPNVVSVSPVIPSPGGKIAMVSIIPKKGPNDLTTKDLVEDIRSKAENIEKKHNVKLMVTGSTAVNIDISDKLSAAIPKFAIVVLGLALVLMTIVFRSILIPIKAILGFVMTLAATFGFCVLTLQKGYGSSLLGVSKPGPILCFMPILLIGIVFGLAMDYEVFLVSGIREHYNKNANAKEAVVHGLKSSGTVVAAAGLIMTVVFTSFATQADINIKSMGLALAFGVLFDAFIVRMTLVPAVMTLLGDSAWYIPKWLDNILPKFELDSEDINEEEGTLTAVIDTI